MNEEHIEDTQAPSSTEQQQSPTSEQQPAGEQTAENVLLKRISELELLAGQYKDQLLRKAAEFENFKKRTENDFYERVKYANEDLVFDLLPVLDDVERSLKAGKEKKDFDTLYRGIELISQKFFKILEANGVVPYDSVAKPFDPHLHDALMQVPGTDLPPHTVVEEVEKGYKMHGKVLRHAKVLVSSESTEEAGTSQKDGGNA